MAKKKKALAAAKTPAPAPAAQPETKKDPIIHVRRFMSGRLSPREVHAALAVGKPCECGRPGVGHIRSFIDVTEFIRREPVRAALIASMHHGTIPVLKSTYGNLFKVGEITPCDSCWSMAEKVAAKHPDFVMVEISRGPKNVISASVPAMIQSALH